MNAKRTFREMSWTPEDRARHKAIRERFQRERPTPQQLIESGEYTKPIPNGVYWGIQCVLHDLKLARESSGRSIESLAVELDIHLDELIGLERRIVESLNAITLARDAAALGKRLVLTLEDIEPKPAKA